MKAYIMAGGKGTRLSSITKDEIPKPMALMCGKPILQHTIEKLVSNGITEIYISVGHLHEKIESYFEDGKRFGAEITYIVENEPLGSGGALFYLKDKIKETFLICSADTIFDIDIERMLRFHKMKNAQITLFAHPNLHPYDSDLVLKDENDCVVGFDLKNSERKHFYKNNVNAGFFILEPSTLEYFTEVRKLNLEHDFINYYIDKKGVFCYKSTEYIKDVGTPERFAATEKDLRCGLVEKKNLKNKQKAIFLDRDGTINKYKGFIRKLEDIELVEDAVEAIKKINCSEYLAIIISNQPVIARGEVSFKLEDEMFNKIETLLGLGGAYIDGSFYCPHHPHKGYEGEVVELKIDCDCRKPKLGLIKKAVEEFNLDLKKCKFIGDSNVDVLTSKNAGIDCVKVKSDLHEENEEIPKFNADNLLQAVEFLIGEDK